MLKGKTALITGGSTGIGRAIALEMAKNGADIALNYLGHAEQAGAVRAEITALGQKCEIYPCDVSSFDESKKMIDAVIKDFSRVDILVNNAGITKDGLIMTMTEKDFDAVVSVNLKGCFNMIKHLSTHFVRNRAGCIINMASVVGMMGNAAQANYAASKAGLIGLTKSVAKELGGRGITCNAIAPGYIATDMTAVLPDAVREKFVEIIPLKRAGTPQDVAQTAVFLAAAGYITGEIIKVDGGMYI